MSADFQNIWAKAILVLFVLDGLRLQIRFYAADQE